jgi:SAM-dependent methyltransferase
VSDWASPQNRGLARLRRLVRNAATDLRFGGFLGGSEVTRFGASGAYDISNTDYLVLSAIFRDRIAPGDVPVDVGCGKGRVLNHWLASGLKNTMIGIELDPDVAARTRRRLRRYRNVTVLAGDAVRLLPTETTVCYLFNPFAEDVVARFKGSFESRCPSALLIYYNPKHLTRFSSDDAWRVETVDLKPQLPAGYPTHTLALLRFQP